MNVKNTYKNYLNQISFIEHEIYTLYFSLFLFHSYREKWPNRSQSGHNSEEDFAKVS